MTSQPKLVTPVLQVLHRMITRHLLGQAGLKSEEADSGAVTLIQRFGSATNLNIHLHCLVLDGVYKRGIDRAPEFVEVREPTDEALQAVFRKIITRLMKLLTRRGVLVEEEGSTYMADNHGDSDGVRVLRPLQAAAGRSVYLSHCLRPARRPAGADAPGRHSPGDRVQANAVRRHGRQQSSTPQCAARPTTRRRWSNCAATSPARHWPMDAD